MASKSNSIDMVNGPLVGKIIKFAMPIAASTILQQLFNSADVAVAGHFVGSNALAAVGSNSAVISMFVTLITGLSVGANVIIAKFIGENRKDKISNAVHTSFSFSILCGLFLLLVGMIISRPVLELISTPANVLDSAVLYLRIYFVGIPFIVIYNFCSSMLRSIGDTKRPLYCLIFSGIINVALNLFFVIVLKMGVSGVALATVLSNVFSTILVVVFLVREKSELKLDFKKLNLDKTVLKQIIVIGLPAGIQGMVFSVSNVCIQSGINSFGSDAVAGSSTGLNFEYFTYYIANAFSQAAVTFTSQNYGAGKIDRCQKTCHICWAEGMVFTAILSLIFVVKIDWWVMIYTSDPAVAEYAKIRMMHVMILEFMTCIYEVPCSVMRGLGRSLTPSILTVIGSCGFRILWLYTVFKKVHTFDMLMSVYPVSWIFTMSMVLTAYFIIIRKEKRNMKISSPL
ncbi:MAG: MATE family efflux transporter [Oscillospiraceae bacterium]|nr:MATE family efflux transporter [Oscillospiraceae bacterium]MDD6085633.1 MATE family efflux transporter [Oscillospiraceae bacterium]MDY3257114.1 MATE family efflux transporter [Ruminococcus callidus]